MDTRVQRTWHRLSAWLERSARRRVGMPAPQVLVRSPGGEFTFGDVARPFHSASVGKVMTATLITMLVERGRFSFDTPVGALLPASDVKDLPAAPGVDVTTAMTVEHLLTHTSGLPDYFDPPNAGRTEASLPAVAADRHRYWTPAELLNQARSLPPVGRPGQRFHYSDTAYVLLGRIAEEATGERLASLLHGYIFEPSGMEQTSTPYSSARSADELADLNVAPFWLDGHELSRAPSMSIDWAGGGIVAPADDLVRFQRVLHGRGPGRRLVAPELLAWMTRPRHRLRRGIHYGAGAVTLRFGEFFPLLRGLPQPIGGLGVLATHMFHYPQHDTHVILNFHSNRQLSRSFRAHIRIAQLLAGPRGRGS